MLFCPSLAVVRTVPFDSCPHSRERVSSIVSCPNSTSVVKIFLVLEEERRVCLCRAPVVSRPPSLVTSDRPSHRPWREAICGMWYISRLLVVLKYRCEWFVNGNFNEDSYRLFVPTHHRRRWLSIVRGVRLSSKKRVPPSSNAQYKHPTHDNFPESM